MSNQKVTRSAHNWLFDMHATGPHNHMRGPHNHMYESYYSPIRQDLVMLKQQADMLRVQLRTISDALARIEVRLAEGQPKVRPRDQSDGPPADRRLLVQRPRDVSAEGQLLPPSSDRISPLPLAVDGTPLPPPNTIPACSSTTT